MAEVDICNAALAKLGATRITSLADGSLNADLCAEAYERCRDDLLRTHTWNFATARVKLDTPDATAPVFGFENRFPLPADWLRTISVFGDEAGCWQPRYKVEASLAADTNKVGFVLADPDEIWLRYIKRVSNTDAMTPDFRELLATLIARELAMPIAQSNTLEEKLEERYRNRLRRVRSVDGIEDYVDQWPESSWVSARHGGSDGGWGHS